MSGMLIILAPPLRSRENYGKSYKNNFKITA
jgi:hypothetical protein